MAREKFWKADTGHHSKKLNVPDLSGFLSLINAIFSSL